MDGMEPLSEDALDLLVLILPLVLCVLLLVLLVRLSKDINDMQLRREQDVHTVDLLLSEERVGTCPRVPSK